MTIEFRSDVTVEVLDQWGGIAKTAEAARVSTIGERSHTREPSTRDDGLVTDLASEGHNVPFEHSGFTFYVHAPVFVTRQILKHRISSISEESGRYRELKPVFYVPGGGRKLGQVGKAMAYEMVDLDDYGTGVALTYIERAARDAWVYYHNLIDLGVSREVARMVLPVNIYSSMHITLNLSSLLNFLSKRVDWGADAARRSHPQHETEMVARKMAAVLEERLPTIWAAFVANGYRGL